MDTKKLNFIEASFLIIIVMITHIISDLPNDIIVNCSSASILNVLFIIVLAILLFLIINKFFSPFKNQDILNVAEFIGGKFLKRFLSIIYILYLIFASSILIRGFAETLKLIYFPNVNIITIIISFILVALLTNKFSSNSIIKTNTIILPQILISILMVFISSINSFDYNAIFPIMGNGVKETFLYGSKNIYAFAGLLFIFLIRPCLKNVNDFKKVGLISIIISGLYLLFSVSSILMLFPYQLSGKETLSMYFSTRTVEFGRFFQRSDAIFMFVWIFTFLSYLSVIFYYLNRISKVGLSLSNKNTYQLYIFALLVFIISVIPKNFLQISFINHYVYKYVAIIVVFFISFSILLIAYIKKRRSIK